MSIEAIIGISILVVVVAFIAYSRKGRKPGTGSIRPPGDSTIEK